MACASGLIASGEIGAPDLICGGTPCQAFSLAGWKRGLEDLRGNLTLSFVDIINHNDFVRSANGLSETLVLWENVEGVLKDKTNAFGCFVSSLAGLDTEISAPRWPLAGVIYGRKRNIAWRVLDAKFFGPPQQRRRLYVVAGGPKSCPEAVLFERGMNAGKQTSHPELSFAKDGSQFEVFREYTDCIYAAYGTKWNGNAAAYNGSLFTLQDSRLRRLTPLECERLMGFPDGYTALDGAKPTSRYQALGNSWSVPVIQWIGDRLKSLIYSAPLFRRSDTSLIGREMPSGQDAFALDLSGGPVVCSDNELLNTSERPNTVIQGKLVDYLSADADDCFYISPAGCFGILRRQQERKLPINTRLKKALEVISAQWSEDKIDAVSRKQKRGRFSSQATNDESMTDDLFAVS